MNNTIESVDFQSRPWTEGKNEFELQLTNFFIKQINL